MLAEAKITLSTPPIHQLREFCSLGSRFLIANAFLNTPLAVLTAFRRITIVAMASFASFTVNQTIVTFAKVPFTAITSLILSTVLAILIVARSTSDRHIKTLRHATIHL